MTKKLSAYHKQTSHQNILRTKQKRVQFYARWIEDIFNVYSCGFTYINKLWSRPSAHFWMWLIGYVFLSASDPKWPSWCTRSSTAVHLRTLARSLTLPTFQVAENFALSAATASFSLRFTAPLLAAEHFRLLAVRYELPVTGGYVGTVPGDLPHSTRDVPVYWVISRHSADLTFFVYALFIVDLAAF